MKNKVIVTGGAGFIGSHTVVELIKNGFEPIILDNLSNSSESMLKGIEEITGEKIKFYKIDCSNYNAVFQILLKERNVRGVIHFAAFKSVAESQKEPVKYYKNNIGSLLNMIQLMERFKISNLVFSSSATVYGEATNLPVKEDEGFKPAESAYGETKQMCEQIIQNAVKASRHLKATLLRYFNPIGAHPSGLIGELPLGPPENLVPYIMQTAFGIREKLTVYGNDYDTPDGTCIRDYIHVVDLAKAHLKAFNWLQAKHDINPCEAFNIGTGKGNTVLELIKMVEEIIQVKVNYEIGNRRGGDIEKSYADCSKAECLLNWKAELSTKDALIDTANWQQQITPLPLSIAS